jgi:alpha-N-arabinofuranosidase
MLVTPARRARVGGFTTDWKKYAIELRQPTATSLKAHLNVFVDETGSLDVDMVSLMPTGPMGQSTEWTATRSGQLLKDMKPGFLRFPVAVSLRAVIATRYQWKTTIRDIIDRHLIINRWNDEFRHKPAPDYYQSFGLGFYEYFQLSEDIGAAPLPILNCGMACQFNSNELAPLDDLDTYSGCPGPDRFRQQSDHHGMGRNAGEELGHPAPFNLKMIGVGNEQWGPQYIERYKIFAKVLKEKHPEITLVTPAGPSPNDERFQFLWANLRALNADIVDDTTTWRPSGFATM